MIIPRKDRCGTCKFRQHISEPGRPRKLACHFYPPQLTTFLLGVAENGVPKFGDYVKFTPVAESDWCGQWQPGVERPMESIDG